MCPVLHIRTLCQGQKPQRGHSSLPSPVPVTASPQTRPQWLALSLHLPSLFRHWQSEADRQPSSVVSQDSCCERVGKGYRVCFATKKASLEIKKKKKSALICAKVTFLCVKSACGRGGRPRERNPCCAGRGPLEVLQQAQDALLLALPELRAPAVPDVLRVLWGDRNGVRCESGA